MPTRIAFVTNTLLYQNRTGCQWALLPHDLLPQSTVYDYFAKWRDNGLFQQIVDVLRPAIRQNTPPAPGSAPGREPTPRAVCVDGQTVKTTEMGGERGYDGAKKNFHAFRGNTQAELLGWLRCILLNSTANLPRIYCDTEKREVGREVAVGDVPGEMLEASRSASLGAHLIACEQDAQLHAALQKLSGHYREVVLLGWGIAGCLAQSAVFFTEFRHFL